MIRRRWEQGYSSVDVIMGIVLLSLVILTVYRVFIPAFALSRNTDERLARQQDVRLAIDRLARELHETTLSQSRLVVYSAGCTGAYQGCIGYATARTGCTGSFQLINGSPNWQAVIYVWRDTATNELRRRCDTAMTFPALSWPPSLTPHDVVATEVIQAGFALVSGGVEIRLRERAPISSRSSYRYQTEFVNQTVFVPQNR